MEIEVNHEQLYALSDYLTNMSQELKKDQTFINSLAESLSQALHGLAEESIAARMKNFNSTQFSKVTNRTELLANNLKNGAKIYNSEESDFEQNMKKEVIKYEQI